MTSEDAGYVTLVSKEGHKFIIEKRCALVSGTIKAMLSGGFSESHKNVVQLPEISTPILERVVQYLYYKVKFTESKVPVPDFDIEPEIALELLMASNFLDC